MIRLARRASHGSVPIQPTRPSLAEQGLSVTSNAATIPRVQPILADGVLCLVPNQRGTQSELEA